MPLKGLHRELKNPLWWDRDGEGEEVEKSSQIFPQVPPTSFWAGLLSLQPPLPWPLYLF